MRHANQQAFTVQTDPQRRARPSRRDASDRSAFLNLVDDELLRTGTKLPERHWCQSENGLWHSTPRGSDAHRAARTRIAPPGRASRRPPPALRLLT